MHEQKKAAFLAATGFSKVKCNVFNNSSIFMKKFLVSVAILLIVASWASFVRGATLRQHETQPLPATVPPPPPGQEIDLEGILDIYIADNFENHQEEHVYLLRHTSGETHHLIFDEKAPRALHTGAFVRVKGHSHDHQRVKHAMSDKHKAAKVTQIDMVRSWNQFLVFFGSVCFDQRRSHLHDRNLLFSFRFIRLK
jgi:hypothetical protein